MVQFLKSKRNIAQTMHINDVFAMNSKMRNETSFEMKQKNKYGIQTKFNCSSLFKYFFIETSNLLVSIENS